MRNLEIAKEAYDAFSRGDMAKFTSLCDEDIEWIYYGSVPWAELVPRPWRRHAFLRHSGQRNRNPSVRN
jgi:ketosteroid isomerase-like protein